MKVQMRASEPYIPVGRNLLQIADASQEPVTVDKDLWSKAYLVSSRGSIPEIYYNGDGELIIPTFIIASNPVVEATESEEFFQQAIARGYDGISRQEDIEIFKTINAAVPEDHSVRVTGVEELEKAIWHSIATLREHTLNVNAIVMHPYLFEVLKFIKCSFLTTKGCQNGFGKWNEEHDVYTSNMCPKNAIYVTAMPNTVGVLAIEQEAFDVPDTESPLKPSHLIKPNRKGRVISEKIGVCVCNEYAISRVLVTGCRLCEPPPREEKPSKDYSGVETVENPRFKVKYPKLFNKSPRETIDLSNLDTEDAEPIDLNE